MAEFWGTKFKPKLKSFFQKIDELQIMFKEMDDDERRHSIEALKSLIENLIDFMSSETYEQQLEDAEGDTDSFIIEASAVPATEATAVPATRATAVPATDELLLGPLYIDDTNSTADTENVKNQPKRNKRKSRKSPESMNTRSTRSKKAINYVDSPDEASSDAEPPKTRKSLKGANKNIHRKYIGGNSAPSDKVERGNGTDARSENCDVENSEPPDIVQPIKLKLKRKSRRIQIVSETDENVASYSKSASVKKVRVAAITTKRKYVEHRCRACDEVFHHARTFKRHLSSHGADGVCCRLCRSEFANAALYEFHLELCKKTNSKNHACDECPAKFLMTSQLRRHVRLKHQVQSTKYFCVYCSQPKFFSRKLTLYKHYKIHAEGRFVCLHCGEFIADKEEYYAHVTSHKRGSSRNTCKQCDKTFDTRALYVQHKRVHDPLCAFCGEAFASKSALRDHVHDAHPDELKYGCTECDQKFFRPKLLEKHLKIHSGERPVKCEICDMFFRTIKAYKKHEMTNSHLVKTGQRGKERTHLCALCGQAYFRKYALQRHMKTHTDERPHQCPHCDYKCRENTNLKRHILRHFSERNFICELCGSAFHTKKTLETHILYRHTNTRNFQCPKCPQAFKTPNALSRHQTCHSQLKPHLCWCGSSFNRQYNLRRHMKSVHGTDQNMPPARKVKVIDEERNERTEEETERDVSDAISREIAKVSNQLLLPQAPCMDIVARSIALSGGFTDQLESAAESERASSQTPLHRESTPQIAVGNQADLSHLTNLAAVGMEQVISDIVYQRTPLPQSNYERTIQCMTHPQFTTTTGAQSTPQSDTQQQQQQKYIPQPMLTEMLALTTSMYGHNSSLYSAPARQNTNIVQQQQQQQHLIGSHPQQQQQQQQRMLQQPHQSGTTQQSNTGTLTSPITSYASTLNASQHHQQQQQQQQQQTPEQLLVEQSRYLQHHPHHLTHHHHLQQQHHSSHHLQQQHQ